MSFWNQNAADDDISHQIPSFGTEWLLLPCCYYSAILRLFIIRLWYKYLVLWKWLLILWLKKSWIFLGENSCLCVDNYPNWKCWLFDLDIVLVRLHVPREGLERKSCTLDLECAIAAVATSILLQKLTGRLLWYPFWVSVNKSAYRASYIHPLPPKVHFFFVLFDPFGFVLRRGEEENKPMISLFLKTLLLHWTLTMVTFQAICFDFSAACVYGCLHTYCIHSLFFSLPLLKFEIPICEFICFQLSLLVYPNYSVSTTCRWW